MVFDYITSNLRHGPRHANTPKHMSHIYCLTVLMGRQPEWLRDTYGRPFT